MARTIGLGAVNKIKSSGAKETKALEKKIAELTKENTELKAMLSELKKDDAQ